MNRSGIRNPLASSTMPRTAQGHSLLSSPSTLEHVLMQRFCEESRGEATAAFGGALRLDKASLVEVLDSSQELKTPPITCSENCVEALLPAASRAVKQPRQSTTPHVLEQRDREFQIQRSPR